MVKTTSKSPPQRKSSLKAAISAVLMLPIDAFSVRASQKFWVQAKISAVLPVFLHYNSIFCDCVISNCINVSDSCIFSYCRNPFNSKLKKPISKQSIFYNPANSLWSSEESLLAKHWMHPTLIGICSVFPWFSLKIQNICQRRNIVSWKFV